MVTVGKYTFESDCTKRLHFPAVRAVAGHAAASEGDVAVCADINTALAETKSEIKLTIVTNASVVHLPFHFLDISFAPRLGCVYDRHELNIMGFC